MQTITSTADRHVAQQGLRDLGLGFFYWLGVVLVLEPGNLLHGTPPDAAAWGHEGLRLLGAGLLGGIATPVVLALTRRLPIEGPRAWRRVVAHVAFCGAMACLLVVASCLLASLLPGAARYPFEARIADELVANGLLVAGCLGGLTALAHARRSARRDVTPAYSRNLAVARRGHMARLDLEAVSWIETQGNYLALHGAEGTRLVRVTAKSLETQLDPRRFVRIHRRAIVAVAAVQAITPRDAGDATVHLYSGEDLRVSRSYRARLWKAVEDAG
jgi:hypothetical protein